MNTLESLRVSYRRLPPREQKWLLAGAIVLILYLLYALILAPTLSEMRRASQETAHDRHLYAWIQRQIPLLARAGASPLPATSPETVQSGLKNLLKTLPVPSHRLHLSEPQPGVWKIRIRRTSYAGTLSRLLPFIARHGLTIRHLHVRRSTHRPKAVDIALEISTHAHAT